MLSGGRNPGYDPLALIVDECHKRAMECHAWLVTFPVGSNRQVKRQGNQSVVARHGRGASSWQANGFSTREIPEVRDYLVGVVDEIVTKYDVDGIHLDYVRYPDDARRFPDARFVSEMGAGGPPR